MPVNYTELGKKIAFYRTKNKMTQEQLGEVIHLVSRYVSRVEKGDSRPSLDSVVDIANVLGVTTDMLLQDSLKHTDVPLYHAVAEALGECSELEVKIILRILKDLKEVLRDFDI